MLARTGAGPEAPPPHGAVIQLFMQYWISCATLAAANLGVADAVDDAPRDVSEIAKKLGVDESSLFRLMRGLASVAIFQETTPRQFRHTPLSAALRTGAPGNARALIRMFGLKSTREAMAEYEYAIQTGHSAFERVHDTVNPYDVLGRRPDEAAVYHTGMSLGLPASFIAASLDLSSVELVVDIGGARGTLLAEILKSHPAQRGILFDLPEVVSDAGAVLDGAGVGSRCEVRGGDMRAGVPSGGNAYILKNIFHGWPDEECVALLRHIRAAAAPGARVFVIENVMPQREAPPFAVIFDLFLLMGGNRSKVRTESEFRALFEQTGFRLKRVIPIFEVQSVVEAQLSG